METDRTPLSKISLLVITVFASFVLGSSVFAYDQNETHRELTRFVSEFYNLVKPENQLSRDDIANLAHGSIAEDNGGRFFHHFYDPIKNQGLWGKSSSKQWSQDISAQANLFGAANEPMNDATNQTWQRAIYDYVKGNRKEAMYALGHVLHLVEDATVPEHVRDDAHSGAPGDPKSPLENWAKGPQLAALSSTIKELPKGLPAFESLDAVFDDTALYTNKKFFSAQTIGLGGGYTSPDVHFFGKDEEAKDSFVAYGVEEGSQLYRLAAKPMVDIEPWKSNSVSQSNFPIGFSIAHGPVMQDYWSRLSKKAIINGAATIDLFFREVERYRQNPELMAEWNKPTNLVARLVALVRPERREESAPSSQAPERRGPPVATTPTLSPDSIFQEKRVVSDAFVSRPSPVPSPLPSPMRETKPLLSQTLKTTPPPETQVAQVVVISSPSPTPAPKLLISEIQIAGLTADDEFVELYNPNDQPVDLAGWSIKRKTSTGNEYSLLASSRLAGKTIPGRGYFLAVNESGYRGRNLPDVSWAPSNTISANNTVLLYAPDKTEAVDKVGFGSATDSEAEPTINTEKNGQSLSRSSANDTDNNKTDFMLSRATPRNTQQNAGAFVPPESWVDIQEVVVRSAAPSPSPVPLGQVTKILINEIRPYGNSADDEFVELFNPNGVAIDLTGWYVKRKTSGGTEPSLVSASRFQGKTIPARGFLLLADPEYRGSVTPDVVWATSSLIAASNTILLYNVSDRLVDKVGFGDAQDFETATATNPQDSFSIERRRVVGFPQDTDNNQVDFVINTNPTPQNTQSPPVHVPTTTVQNVNWGKDASSTTGFSLSFDYSQYPLVDHDPANPFEGGGNGIWHAISFYLNQDAPTSSNPTNFTGFNFDPTTPGAHKGLLISYPTCGWGTPAPPSRVSLFNNPDSYKYQDTDGSFYYSNGGGDCENSGRIAMHPGEMPHTRNPTSTSPWTFKIEITGLTDGMPPNSLTQNDYITFALWHFQSGWDKQWNFKIASQERYYF